MRSLTSRPDPTFLIPLAVFLLLVRVPGGIFLLGVVGVVLVLWRGVRPVRTSGLLVSYAVCVLTSGAAAWWFDDHNVTNYVWPAVCFGLFSAAVLWTGDRERNLLGLTQGLLAGFATALALAWFEIVTGLRLLTVGQQNNRGLQQSLSDGRFRTGAFYTNYNDLSVALTILAILVAASILFVPRVSRNLQVLRIGILALSATLVLLMGSRGSLGALLLGLGALALLAARAARPQVWTGRRLLAILAAAGVAAFLAWQSPYVQDHSTASRERIVNSALTVLDVQPISWVIGYSSDLRYLHAGAALFPGELMNPHNLILEFLIAYGILALVTAGACWGALMIGAASVIQPRQWTLPAFTAGCLVIPVIGTVPSSTLPYGFPQLLALGLATALVAESQTRSAHAPPRTVAESGHHQ